MRVAPALPEIRAAEAAVEPRTVRRRAVRPAAAVQSDAAVGSPGPRYRVVLVAAVEPEKAAHPVRAAAAAVAVVAAPHAAAAIGAVVPDALVVAPVPAVGPAAAPVAAAAALAAVSAARLAAASARPAVAPVA